MKSRITLVGFGLLWLLAVSVGLRAMAVYEDTPGQAASPAGQWPAGTSIALAKDRDTLLIMAHPQCPCTRATLGELNALMAQCQGRLAVYVLFFKPKGFAAGWEKTDLWHSAAAIPGVQVLSDIDAGEARRFNAKTSGQTLLFDSNGHLLFKGGITEGRGHAGDNAGREAIASLVTTGKAERSSTPVFGCALYSSKS